MEGKNLSLEQLRAVVEYIIFEYDHNVHSILNLKPTINIFEQSNVFVVKIEWMAGMERAHNPVSDSITHKDDKPILADAQFTLLKPEGFFTLNKYMTDICEEMEVYSRKIC
jgi:hypothetical protein